MQSAKMRKQKQRLSQKCHSTHGNGRVMTELDVRVGVFRQPAMQTPVLRAPAS